MSWTYPTKLTQKQAFQTKNHGLGLIQTAQNHTFWIKRYGFGPLQTTQNQTFWTKNHGLGPIQTTQNQTFWMGPISRVLSSPGGGRSIWVSSLGISKQNRVSSQT